jgi:hypothetical protein
MNLSEGVLELCAAVLGAHEFRIFSLMIGTEVGFANCVGLNDLIEDIRSSP